MKLEGKRALVTGAARRIGRGLAEALAARGCRLALHCNRSVAEAEELARDLRRRGAEAYVIRQNLLTPGAGEKLVRRARKLLGGLDILVNNAAVFEKETITAATEKSLRGTIEINLMAPVLLTRAFAAQSAKGKIVNILDRRIAGREPGLAAYLLSKKALAEFTKIAALELAPGISVNGIAPGPVLAPVVKKQREPAGKIPLNRRPSAADVAGALVFLLENDSITGEIIFVDCGQHLEG